MKNELTMIQVQNLHPFREHPYQVRDDEELAALRSKFRYIRHVTLRYLMTPCETCRFCADRYRVDKWTNRIGDGHDWICQMDEGGQAK